MDVGSPIALLTFLFPHRSQLPPPLRLLHDTLWSINHCLWQTHPIPHPILPASRVPTVSVLSTQRPASSQDKQRPSNISIITHMLVKFRIFRTIDCSLVYLENAKLGTGFSTNEEIFSTSEGVICGCVLDFLDECICRCTGNSLLTYS